MSNCSAFCLDAALLKRCSSPGVSHGKPSKLLRKGMVDSATVSSSSAASSVSACSSSPPPMAPAVHVKAIVLPDAGS